MSKNPRWRSGRKPRRQFLREGLAALAGVGIGGALLDCGSSAPTLPDAALDGSPADSPPDLRRDRQAAVPDAALPDAPPAPRPTTTVRQRIQGQLPSEKQPDSQRALWGVTRVVPGDPHLRHDLLGADATAGTLTGPPASLLYLTHLTDVHIIDEESPARTVNLDKVISPAWRAQEAHSALLLDAVIRKIRDLSSCRPMDLVIFTGDLIENNQKNELEWFLKTVTGGALQPNSGTLEDPVAGPDNDPHDAFTALGLGSIPWYAAMGNHDGLIQGNLARLPLLNYALLTGDPTRSHINDLELGRVNPPACNPLPPDEAPAPWRCLPSWPAALKPGDLPGDPRRVHLGRPDWLGLLKSAGGSPPGHGLTGPFPSTADGDHLIEPVPGLPLRIVVLNTCASIGPLGSLSDETHDKFLLPALQQAEKDEVLVMVASHHGPGAIPVNGGKLRATLASFPNVVLHLFGHQHDNQVIPRPGATPQHGYWEVQTCSLVEWPQQGRLVELVDCRNGTAELWLTLFDYETGHLPSGPIVAGSRFLALREVHAGAATGKAAEGQPTDRNVILPVALTPALQKRLAALPGKPIESRLFV